MLALETVPAIVRPAEARPSVQFPRQEAFDRAAKSRGNKELIAIAEDLEALVERMEAWAEKHTDCNCVFCYASGNDGFIGDDLIGPTWAMRMAAGFIESEIFGGMKRKPR